MLDVVKVNDQIVTVRSFSFKLGFGFTVSHALIHKVVFGGGRQMYCVRHSIALLPLPP